MYICKRMAVAKSVHMELASVCVSSSDVRGLASHSFSNTACSRALGCVPICWGGNTLPLPTFNLHLGRYGACFNLFSCVWDFFLYFFLHTVLVKMTLPILCFSTAGVSLEGQGPHLSQNALSSSYPECPGLYLKENVLILSLPRML